MELTLPQPPRAALPARGGVASTALTEAGLTRSAELEDRVGAWAQLVPETALAEAAHADQTLRVSGPRSDLHGLPIAIKDMIDVAGVPTRCGSRHPASTPSRDALIVTALRRAGAVILGKATTHEFACGTTTPGTTHPVAPDRIVGGSSGGSAAAVAAGYCRVALGTDTGGSVRIPAALCGVFGLKPTLGVLPTDGVVPLSPSVDHLGLIASDIAHLALAWRVLARVDGNDGAPPAPGRRLRVGVAPADWSGPLEPAVAAATTAAVAELERIGHQIVSVRLPSLAPVSDALRNTVLPEAAAFHAERLISAPELFSLGVRMALETGASVTPAARQNAALRRRQLIHGWDAVLDPTHGVDVVVTATVPVTAPLIGATEHRWPDQQEPLRDTLPRLTAVHNLTGLPALTVPVAADGLPVGVQLVGRRHQEAQLLALGATLQS